MPQKLGGGLLRSKAGCTTCKSRKKKCDEVKPRCAGCRRNQLVCEWPLGLLEADSGRAITALDDTQTSLKIPPPVAVVHAGFERPCALTPQSVILLGHYVRETAGCVAMTQLNDNPFVTILLPLGYVDDLLMHGLLALSGAHLTYREPENIELETATMLHYSRLISGLRVEFASLQARDVAKKESLLRSLIVACHYEVGFDLCLCPQLLK